MSQPTVIDRLLAGVVTRSAEDMRALAAEFGAVLPRDRTLALHGDLGVGKTTFVQGLAAGLGVTGAVTSPTFNIFTLHRGPVTLVHLDAYRLESPGQVEDLLLSDFLVSPWILAVEWPERIGGWLPADTLDLELGIHPDESHEIRLRRPGSPVAWRSPAST